LGYFLLGFVGEEYSEYRSDVNDKLHQSFLKYNEKQFGLVVELIDNLGIECENIDSAKIEIGSAIQQFILDLIA